MNHPIKQPIVNSRTFSSRSSSNFLDKSLSGSFEDPYNALLTRKPSFHSKNTPFSSQKTGYTLFKIDPHLIEQYLEKYKAANLYYRDEEFSQQADNFLTKVAMDRKIPDEYRARFPVYQILVSISKIFMLNEFEIVAFACLIDNCPWNIDEILSFDEANYLNEFPSNFGLEIGVECKRFIIYLLFIAFTLKQYLGEKNEIDYIQAYCETICQNFQMLFNRWVKAASNMRFQYSLPEINSKFRYLAKRDLQGHQSSVKDYNMMVDEIMGLTGTYTTRTKDMKPIGHPEPFFEQTKQFKPQKTQVFENNFFQQPPIHIPETKPFQGTSISFPEERGLSRSGTFDFFESGPGFRMPSFLQNISRQPSLKNTSSLLRRQTSIDMMGDTMGNKPRTGEESNRVPNLQTQPSFLREFSMSGWAKPDLQTSFSSIFKQEDIGNNAGGAGSTGNINLPMLSKKASVVSQEPDDLPTLSRFQSNLSFLYEKNN